MGVDLSVVVVAMIEREEVDVKGICPKFLDCH